MNTKGYRFFCLIGVGSVSRQPSRIYEAARLFVQENGYIHVQNLNWDPTRMCNLNLL
jgi:hypothetical protein